jgi:hypothetical protein
MPHAAMAAPSSTPRSAMISWVAWLSKGFAIVGFGRFDHSVPRYISRTSNSAAPGGRGLGSTPRNSQRVATRPRPVTIECGLRIELTRKAPPKRGQVVHMSAYEA